MQFDEVVKILEKGKQEVITEENKLREAILAKDWKKMWKQLVRVMAISGSYLKVCNDSLPLFRKNFEESGCVLKSRNEILKEEGLEDVQIVKVESKDKSKITDKKIVPKKMIVIPKKTMIM